MCLQTVLLEIYFYKAKISKVAKAKSKLNFMARCAQLQYFSNYSFCGAAATFPFPSSTPELFLQKTIIYQSVIRLLLENIRKIFLKSKSSIQNLIAESFELRLNQNAAKKLVSWRFQPSLQLYEVNQINIQKSNVHIPDLMPKQQEEQIFQFVLTVLTVKMKVKFPCKMTLQQAGRNLTTEVSPNQEERFVFNQEVRIREQTDKLFTQLNICLITEKGSRYISGTAKLYHNEILRSEGQRLVVTLSKCLDTEAFCQMRVEKIIRESPVRPRTLTTIPQRNKKYISAHNEQMNQIPTDFRSPKKNQPVQLGFQSQSQYRFPVVGSLRIGSREDERRAREYTAMAGNGNTSRKRNPSPKARSKQYNSKSKYQYQDFQRQKVLQGEVYRESYQKLKQKYLKEAQVAKSELNKRILLENNENNYKLQIVRLKLKSQELQKSLIDKNLKLKELALNLSSLQGLQSELNFFREDVANKQHAIDIMDDTIITLSKENDELRLASKQNLYKLQERILVLQNELQMVEAKNMTKKEQMEREIKNLHEMLQNKQAQVSRKAEMLQKDKKTIYQLQKSLQNKLFQYDQQLQNERNLCQKKLDESKLKIQQAHQQNLKLTLQKDELSSQVDKLKGLLLKNEYQFKLYQQQITTSKTQIEELRVIRDKYNQMIKQLRSLSQQKMILERNHDLIMVSKQTTIDSLTVEYKKQIQTLKRGNRDLQERFRNLSARFIQSQSQLEMSKGGVQKLKRSNENMSKDLAEFKQRQKQLKKSLKSKEQQLEDTRRELTRLKQKNQSLAESIKNQISTNRDELSRLKVQLESEIGKNEQLFQTNSQLNMQLARMKMSLKFADEKYEKLVQSSHDKYGQFQAIIKEHQNVIQMLQEKFKTQKDNEKDLITRLQKYDYQMNMTFDKNQKLSHELQIFQQKNRQLEGLLRTKQGQLMETLKRIGDLQQRTEHFQQSNKQLKNQLQFKHSQLQKSKKMVEILQKDFQKAKTDILAYCRKLNQQEKQLDDQIRQSRREKDSLATVESKYNNLKRQHEKFKNSISQALSTSFDQAFQSFADKSQSIKSTTFSNQLPLSIQKGKIDVNEIVTAISSAGKQSRTQIQKLHQKVRNLQRDLDLRKSQLERAQEETKKQIFQKASQIQQLEHELKLIKNEKGESQIKNTLNFQQLFSELKHYKSQYQSLISTKNQLQFSLGSLRIQFQKINEDYNKKLANLHYQKNQLQQKLEYQFCNTEIAEKRIHELQIQLMNINQALTFSKEQTSKRQLRLLQASKERERILQEIQGFKKRCKQSQQKYTELEIQFAAIKQAKERYERDLSEEENKIKQLRVFNNNILKEKQEILKKELEKHLEITELQDSIVDLRHSLQQEIELKTKLKAELEETRELTKKYMNQAKDLESILGQQRSKYNEIRDKLRQKEQTLSETKEQNRTLKTKLQEAVKKSRMSNEQLEMQNSRLYKQIEIIKIESHSKISSLQSQLLRANQQLHSSKEEVSQLEQALFVERENNNAMHQSVNKLKRQIQEYRKKAEQMEKIYEQMLDQNRQKDETMFEMGGKLFQYESKVREMEEQKLREVQQLTTSLNVKYDQDYQEIYQKIECIEKEKDYYKQKYNQKEQELTKKNEQLRHLQIDKSELKKACQEKIKKLEEQKLAIFTEKNKELTKALAQNKAQFQALRQKQGQLRKMGHQLQISRNAIQKLEAKFKQIQNQKQTQIKAYQAQIQNLRKKEVLFKNYKDTVKANQWSCQRQVRKQIQNLIKRWLQGGQKQIRNEALISSIKSIEESLLGAISNVGKDEEFS